MLVRRTLLAIAMLALLAGAARAEDSPLSAIHQLLAPMRGVAHATEGRGATPALTTVKHELRDWFEARLSTFGEEDDEQALIARLNEALRVSDLFCGDDQKPSRNRCDDPDGDWDATGFLLPLRLRRQASDTLVLVTSVGILCGADESGYVYQWRDGRWQRLWQEERPIAEGKPYRPEYLDGIEVSSPDQGSTTRSILSLGHEGWCTSTFYDVYFSLWRVGAAGMPAKLLLDKAEPAWLGWHEPPIEGSVGARDALIEFTQPSIDIDIHSYEAIRHYRIDGAKVVRIDPIALDPADFTEEWLKGDWAESGGWSATGARKTLQAWHARFHISAIEGEYLGESRRCRGTPDLWQVGLRFRTPEHKPLGTGYFFVRWQPPYRFQMIDVATRPRADCNAQARREDGLNTLFPIQEWR
jgi:hypothetical protein